MKKFLPFVLLFSFLSAEIVEVRSILDVDFSEANEETLVIFDMDYTLTMPLSPAFHKPNSWKHRDWIRTLQSSLTDREWFMYTSSFTSLFPSMFVEKEIGPIIKSLQERNIPMMVLTLGCRDETGSPKKDIRYESLKNLGIDFSSHFPDPLILDQLTMVQGSYPIYTKGILSTQGSANSKGAALVAFLEKCNWRPKKVVFLDDRMESLTSTQEALAPLGIDYLGIHYRASEYTETTQVQENELKESWLLLSHHAKETAKPKTYVTIDGSRCVLEVYDTNDVLLKSYPVGLGQNGMGKTKKGDKKTPLGEYHILWKASRFAEEDGGLPISEERAYCSRENGFKITPGDHHGPIWLDDYGGEEAVFICLDYPNEADLLQGHTGYGIAIHASLLGGIGEFSSLGCIRMTPEDARDLYKQVSVGTSVFIF